MTTKNKKTETFISIDVEADGPAPGKNSLLSIGAVACDEEGYVIGATDGSAFDFEVNLHPAPGCAPDPQTMKEFWGKFPEAFKMTLHNRQSPEEGMLGLANWLNALPGDLKTVVMGPSGFDMSYLYYYGHRFLGYSPLGFRVLDIQSFVCCIGNIPFHESTKRAWPRQWESVLPHTHRAIDDAYEQLDSWMRIRNTALYGFNSPEAKIILKRPRNAPPPAAPATV